MAEKLPCRLEHLCVMSCMGVVRDNALLISSISMGYNGPRKCMGDPKLGDPLPHLSTFVNIFSYIHLSIQRLVLI